MAFGTSLIQDFTDALVASLRARPKLERTVVTDGPPPASALQASEWLMLGDVTSKQEWAAISRSRLPKKETFTIEVVISVVAPSTNASEETQPALNRRAMEICHELELELKENHTQGVGVPQGTVDQVPYVVVSAFVSGDLQKRANDTAREAAVVCKIEVETRL